MYHSPCSDGFSAAFAAWKFANDKIVFRTGRPNEVTLLHKADVTGKNVLLLDFTYPKEIMLLLQELAKRVCVIDHHVDVATERLSGVAEHDKILDKSHSGAVLSWMYFHPDVPVPLFVKYVEDNDLWQKTLPNTDAFSAKFNDMKFTFEALDQLMNEDALANLIEQGMTCLSYANGLRRRIVQDAAFYKVQLVDMCLYSVAVVNSPIYKSSLGNMLGDKVDFAMVYHYNAARNQTRFSLRSKPGKTDVNKIAMLYNGGGHPHASAVSLDGAHIMLPNRSCQQIRKP